MLPFKTTTEQKKHLLWLYQEVLLLSYVVTCNNLTVFQRCHCYLNATGISDIWKGVNGHSILRNGAQFIRSTHRPRWCTAWIIFECVPSTYDECLSPSFLWSLFSSPFAPLHLFCHFLNTPFPFLETFLKVLGSIMEDRPNGPLYQIHWDWFSINNKCF